jgi:hypothetical protein
VPVGGRRQPRKVHGSQGVVSTLVLLPLPEDRHLQLLEVLFEGEPPLRLCLLLLLWLLLLLPLAQYHVVQTQPGQHEIHA